MRSALLAIALSLGCSVAGAAGADAPNATDKTLRVCFQANDPPLSVRNGEKDGFAVALSRSIAERLGRELRVQWFVSRDDPDASLVKEANALLSDGRCQLVAEFPLVRDTLGPPSAPAGKLPPFDGAGPDDRRRWVTLGELVATRPYRLDALTVVMSAQKGDRPVHKLADLAGLAVGVEIATLADAIAMNYGDGQLREHVVHVPDARALFGQLQRGEFDAAFVALREVDAWRLKHGPTGLAPTGYVHSVGFNMGFVGLASDRALIEAADEAISALQSHDAIAALANAAGLTYLPPRSPAVSPAIGPTALVGD